MIASRIGNSPRYARFVAAALGLMLLCPTLTQAHFLWLTAEEEKGAQVVRAFLSETPTPDSPDFLKYIQSSKISASGQPLEWTKDTDTYRVTLPATRPAAVDGYCDMGVSKRQDTVARLVYTARIQWGLISADEAELKDHLRLRVIGKAGDKSIVLATFQGKPTEGVEIKGLTEKGDPVVVKTDKDGKAELVGVVEGKVGLLGKYIDKTTGSADGKEFQESRYYSTLTVTPVADSAAVSSRTRSITAKPDAKAANSKTFATLPEPVNSFGGAVLGDWLYVYSGHIGKMHNYHVDTQSKHFRRLNLKDRTTWEELPQGPQLQGVALVANDGKLYRVGGMSARNQPGKPNDLISVADFAMYDPETKTWTDLPPLPAPRSTHDAVVLDNRLYVVGGWTMGGGDSANTDFCDDALVFDLKSPDAKWETLPTQPFHRRALAAATVAGKVYVLGGLTDESKVSKAVDVYDPATKSWAQGPELPGSKMEGFSASAFGVENRLYVSGRDGVVSRLNEAGTAWEPVGKLAIPRLTHRLLPGIERNLLIVGGTSGRSSTDVIEAFPIDGQAASSEKSGEGN